jgi:hypothetical protein
MLRNLRYEEQYRSGVLANLKRAPSRRPSVCGRFRSAMKRLFLRKAAAFFAREGDMKFVVGANTTGGRRGDALECHDDRCAVSADHVRRARRSPPDFDANIFAIFHAIVGLFPAECLKRVRLLGSLSAPSISLGHAACVLRVRRQRRWRSAADKCHELLSLHCRIGFSAFNFGNCLNCEMHHRQRI